MLYSVSSFSGKLTCQVNDCVMNHFNQPTFPQRIILYLYTTEQAQKQYLFTLQVSRVLLFAWEWQYLCHTNSK